MEKRVFFRSKTLAYLLLMPQLAITAIFFLYPAGKALILSFYIEDPFGLKSQFVWFRNFERLLSDPYYWGSFQTTFIFSGLVAFLALSFALLLAVQADRIIRGASAYKTLLIWPYAVAPAIAGVLFLFMFNPSVGVISYYLKQVGYNWNHVLNGGQAMTLVVIAAAWKQISYNFIFFLAGLQAIPRSLIEAAAIDGAGPARRFWSIIFPLLSPTTFFLLVINIVYAFFDTFGIIHTVTQGGPGKSTEILVYKVFSDGYIGNELGRSSAQSVILMILVITLTMIQFRFIERRVHY